LELSIPRESHGCPPGLSPAANAQRVERRPGVTSLSRVFPPVLGSHELERTLERAT